MNSTTATQNDAQRPTYATLRAHPVFRAFSDQTVATIAQLPRVTRVTRLTPHQRIALAEVAKQSGAPAIFGQTTCTIRLTLPALIEQVESWRLLSWHTYADRSTNTACHALLRKLNRALIAA